MPAAKPIRIYDLTYSPMRVPAGCLTEAQWLRQGFRVVGEFQTQLLVLHDRPHNRKRPSEGPFPPEEVAALRARLKEVEWPSDADRWLLVRMELASQVSWCNLYPEDAVEPIVAPTQGEAWELLSNLWRHGSHREQFIFGGEKDGEKFVYTAGGKISREWNILDHKKGVEYLGVKRGDFTRVIDVDLDRHSSSVSSEEHLRKVLDTLRWLQQHLPELAWHITNVNPRNGSCHVTGYLPRAIPVRQAKAVVDDVRSECPWLEGVEVYPDNCPQFILPLRRDKITVIDRVLTPSVKAHYHAKAPPSPNKKRRHGRKPRGPRVGYLAMDAAAYWQWINDEEREPCDLALVEQELRKACLAPLDGGKPGKPRPGGRKSTGKARHDGGVAGIGKLKNRCARVLVDFLRGGDGDARVTSTVMLRAFCNAEDMGRDQAVALTGELLGMRPDFREKPVEDRPRLSRMIDATAKAIWRDNGYQKEPLGSLDVWAKVKVAWHRRGFKLSDPSTWGRAGKDVLDDESDLVWSPWLLGLLPGLAEAARCDLERARLLLRLACVHVGRKAELALSFLALLMAQAGIKAYRDNVVRVRRFLEENGVLVRRKRGFRYGDGPGVGNHYTLGLAVDVARQGQAAPSGLVVLSSAGEGRKASMYPSSGRMDVGPLVERRRLKRCLEHYYQRVRAVGGGLGQAA